MEQTTPAAAREPDVDADADAEDAPERLRALLEQGRFDEAESLASTLLAHAPSDRDGLYCLAVAQRMLKRIPEALATLETLQTWHPSYPRLFQERGHLHIFLRDAESAIHAFQRATQLNPALPASWRSLQTLYRMTGRLADAEIAARHIATLEAFPVEVVSARSMLADGNLREAEGLIRDFLKRDPSHIEGLRVLANIASRQEYANDAVVLLEAVLEKAPDYTAARYDYAVALIDQHRHGRAREELERLMREDSSNPAYGITYAGVLIALGELEAGIERYRALQDAFPADAEIAQSLGHALKTQGDTPGAVAAYRNAVAHQPGFGEAFWSLANLKTYRFTDTELEAMRAQEAREGLPVADRYHLCFALGKGLEDRAEHADSFDFYARGNALKRQQIRYRPEPQERAARRQMELCDEAFFASRAGWGCLGAEPIFVVGLPRAGSTLLEQILASHSMIEGTTELADVPRLVRSLSGRDRRIPSRYPAVLAELEAEQCQAFGEAYLRDTQVYRSGKPRFIDKMPNNYRNVALIHLMLPNARIIDARRDPMDCGFGNFKQLYANGHHFSYGLEDIGRYYRTYVEIMAHWERVLPGRVLRVQHEDVLDDLEGQVRRILDYCGLPFEPSCLDFHRTERKVHTASAAQVRRPLNRDGVDQWRPYAQWLGPLRDALGPLASP